MNERIKKLAETAGFYFYDMHDVDGQDLGESIEADEWSAAEKFAELIVRECAKFLDENSGYDNSNNAWHPEPEDLLKHFGVEE